MVKKTLKSFHLHRKQTVKFKDIPKGCLAIKVGSEGEQQQRFIVPVLYFNHPLFMQLLKEAEDEYGFDQKGTITIPCHVEEFRYVQALIDGEGSVYNGNNHHHRQSGRDQYQSSSCWMFQSLINDDDKFLFGKPRSYGFLGDRRIRISDPEDRHT